MPTSDAVSTASRVTHHARWVDEIELEPGDLAQARDRAELALLEAALERDMPVLAICRGFQELNVVLGGSLETELIAATHSLEEIRKYIDADSVGYLSLEGMLSSVGRQRTSYCTSCYTGQYPVAFPQNEAAYLQLALKLDEQPVKT